MVFNMIHYLIVFFYFASIVFAQDNFVKTYRNDSLGISFDFKEEDNPYGYYNDNIQPIDVREWKIYNSKTLGIQLKYPKFLIVNEENKSIDEIDVIKLGYYDQKYENIFHNIVNIYFEHKNFFEIAESEGFQFSQNKDSAFMGGCGFISLGTNFKGYNCIGLRVKHCDIFSDPDLGAYSIPNEVIESLLIFNHNKEIKLVAHFSDYYCKDNINLTENEFYIIASTIKVVNK